MVIIKNTRRAVQKMANAKKCDRCGKYYHECDPNPFENLAIAFERIATPPSEQKCITTIETFLDLCPSCSKSLKSWVKGNEVVDDGQQG